MPASSLLRRVALSVLSVSTVVAVVPVSLTAVHANTDRLRITFDGDAPAGTNLAAGAPIVDLSGFGNNGVVVTAAGGSVAAVANGQGVAAGFPDVCSLAPCPKALVQIADHPSLDPRTSDFQWGAHILLQSSQTADGENILQKGLFNQVGGQWKLQVDKAGGLPSCVVSGVVPGQTTTRRAVLASSVSVADGIWHQVTCRRTASAGLEILVDGVVRGSAAMQVVDLNSDAPVTIGNKFVDFTNNDQFHGVLDDAFMTVLDNAPPPNTPPAAAFTFACINLVCTFDGSSSTDDGPLTFAWDFGDGGTDAAVAPTHQFTQIGDHTVTLVVTDASGLTSAFARTVTIAANVAPVAVFSSSCTSLSCTFDASASTDDGPLTYTWTFGDGATGTGVAPVHAYTSAGVYAVNLTVTDASTLTSTIDHPVTAVQSPVPTFVGQSSVSAQALNHTAVVPSAVQEGDGMLMFFSSATNATVQQPTGVTGWAPVDTLTNTNGSTRVWRKVAAAGDAGAAVGIAVSKLSKGNITIVAYRGTAAINPVAGFARRLITTNSAARTTPTVNVTNASVVVSYWMHRDGTTTTLTPPVGVTVRATGTQAGTGHVTVLTADSGASAVLAGPYGGLTARASASSTLATTWTIVLANA